ncbi:MAG: tetratricopeptide repeat protein [Bacteroidaceae bacterium]|nr:tetratricopeptide repeat protein [Bacteroidaceae bacterium]
MLDILNLIEHPENLNDNTLPELKDLTEKYPFFQAARILYIRNLYLLHSSFFGTELRKGSVFVPDRTTLFNFSEGVHYELGVANQQNTIDIETENDNNRTMSLIDSFLNQAKHDNQKPTIADLTTDYAAFLMQNEDIQSQEEEVAAPKDKEQNQLKGAHLIDSFIAETKGKQRFEMKDLNNDDDFTSPEISNEDEEIYTESMVNIYIKQGKYSLALEILRKICLNNPEKNSNFATQINLLEVITANK